SSTELRMCPSSVPSNASLRLEVLPNVVSVFLGHIAPVDAVDLLRPDDAQVPRPALVRGAAGLARGERGDRPGHRLASIHGALRPALGRARVDGGGGAAVIAGAEVVCPAAASASAPASVSIALSAAVSGLRNRNRLLPLSLPLLPFALPLLVLPLL